MRDTETPARVEYYARDRMIMASANGSGKHFLTVSANTPKPDEEAQRVAAILNADAARSASSTGYNPAEWCGRPARAHMQGWHLVFDADGMPFPVKWWPAEGCYTSGPQFEGLLTSPKQFSE